MDASWNGLGRSLKRQRPGDPPSVTVAAVKYRQHQSGDGRILNGHRGPGEHAPFNKGPAVLYDRELAKLRAALQDENRPVSPNMIRLTDEYIEKLRRIEYLEKICTDVT